MIFKVPTKAHMSDLIYCAEKVGVFLNDPTQLSERRISFTLRPLPGKDSDGDRKWQARSRGYMQNERRVFAVCWHGHGLFMRELFRLYPEGVISSSLTTHHGAVDTGSAWIKMGPPIMGGYPRACEACSCPYSGSDAISDYMFRAVKS